MSLLSEALTGIYGAYRLARADRRGMDLFDGTVEQCRRSFWAAAIVIPVMEGLRVLIKTPPENAYNLDNLFIIALTWIITWTAFPVLMITIGRQIGIEVASIRYVTLYNWSNVIQVLILLPGLVLPIFIPESQAVFVSELGQFIVLVYCGYMVRVAFGAGWGLCVAVVLLDIELASVVHGMALHLLKG